MHRLLCALRATPVLGLVAVLAACASNTRGEADLRSEPDETPSAPAAAASDTNQGIAGSGIPTNSAGSAAVRDDATRADDPDGSGESRAGGCAANLPFKEAGCPCQEGETAACWTGPAADRNVGRCHDGLQICSMAPDSEFASWGPCMGEQLDCGDDAGVPPPADAGVPPSTECPCIPGAVIQCSEDCSVGIICSLTATKTCLPDRTWSPCREDIGVTLDLPGVQCRNMLHGCFDLLSEDQPAQGPGEIYVGDCSQQFECGHAPVFL